MCFAFVMSLAAHGEPGKKKYSVLATRSASMGEASGSFDVDEWDGSSSFVQVRAQRMPCHHYSRKPDLVLLMHCRSTALLAPSRELQSTL